MLAPIAKGGALHLSRGDVIVRIKQIQLEQVPHTLNASGNNVLLWHRQDTAKSVFDPRQHLSQIDLNRAGTGLVEIVSESDMRSVIPCLILWRWLVTMLSAVLQKRPATTLEHCKQSCDLWAPLMATWNK